MKPKKAFDCVEMKNAIQAKRQAANQGLSPDEIRHGIQDRLNTPDDPITRTWRAVSPPALEDKRGPDGQIP